ncbi:MAG: 2-methylcitrate dehydratase [Tardiphaga sp.]|jgi:2-methylcitrate dehydratase PrpD|nr:2-methylcitrate dehydratase [Tardiphaga sp.]
MMLQNASFPTVRPQWLDRWADFAATMTAEQLPRDVVARTKQVLFDCIGAIAAGAQEPEMQRLTARLCRGSADDLAPVIGAGRRASAGIAAFLNGTAGTMLEIDEGNQFARGHPGIHVVPAVLAAAEELGSRGSDVLLALALGYEIGSRVGIASKLRVTMHPHGTWGTVGAAVAVARLRHATREQMAEVINVSSTLGLATSRRTMLEGGTVRNSFAGFSNEIGLRAWEMVDAGFIGEADGIGTIYGTVIADQFQPEEMIADLGARWEITRNYFKRHAACRYNHGALDALHSLMAQAGGQLKPDDIARIDVDTYIWAAQLDGQQPRNMLAAKFSLPFSLATTIVNGAASIAAFREEARHNAVTLALAGRIAVREDKALTAMLPGLRPARVKITLVDGRVLSAEAYTNKGDAEDPYSAEEVQDKFREVAGSVWSNGHCSLILAAVEDLDRSPDLGALSRLLAA